jgi:hypothetical protein
MRKVTLLLIGLLFTLAATAQNAVHGLSPDDAAAAQAGPVVTFTQDWPAATPPYFSVAVSSMGRVAYQSSPKANTGDLYELKFTMSPENQKLVFQVADQLKHFNGNWDYKKGRIAFTGTKTLSFKDAGNGYSTTYNWSDNVQIQQLTALFQSISETIELGRKLADTYRFDKLGVDAVLKSMEEAAKSNQLAEIQAVQPILSKLAKDSSLMNISRRRAEFLLSKISKGAALAGQP